MFSRFFIDRPIFATVLAILMILVGVITVTTLPIAQFPDITPPSVNVSAVYPGADAQTVAETVGVPIEQQVNGVEGMMYMSSNSSSDGSYSLTVTFKQGVNLDEATIKVQNRVNQAQASLPSAVKQQGVTVNSESSSILLMVAIQNDGTQDYDALYLTNYAALHLTDPLSRLDGVGGVGAFGGGDYSMRVWLDPNLMNVRGVTTSDVMAAIQAQNMQVSAGALGAPPSNQASSFQFTLSSKGRLTTAKQFGDIIIKADDNGNILRLSDIGKVELGSSSYSNVARVNGQQAALLAVQQRPGANALAVSKLVLNELENLKPYFPPGVTYSVVMDTTNFVSASIDDVFVTFIETTLIVMVVILFFLQSWRAVIIPMLTIPVSLIATFAVMKLLGFTLNTLTLFGLVLAIAIVVDDAIVVVEDCQRIVDEGKLSPRQAAEKAMVELQGPVVGEVLVLLSVFIPTAFISGITGELYKQFALTIATSTAFSGFNALTFTPAMCALFLRPSKKTRFFAFKWFNVGWGATVKGYTKAIGQFLKHPAIAIGVYLGLVVGAFYIFKEWRTSYVPAEDMGYCMVSAQLPTGASLDRTDKVMRETVDKLMALPEVKDVVSVSGYSFIGGGAGSNYGSMFVMLKPWSERKKKSQSVFAVVDDINEVCAGIEESVTFAINPPAIPGLGMTSGLEMQILDINSLGPAEIMKVLAEVKDAVKEYPEIASIRSLYEGLVPQYQVKINRDRVNMMGVSLDAVYSALSSFVGGSYVNDFVEFGNVYQVTIASEGFARGNPSDVARLSVRNDQGEMVPFGAFSEVVPLMGAATINRYNMYQTAQLTANTAHGASSSQGIAAMEEVIKRVGGNNFGYAWTGEAYQETQSGTTVSMVLIFAIIMTLLVLAAQYESWTDPIAVILAMPTAIIGCIVGVICMSQSISIYTQIGIVLVLGLAAKNAILIVEYAIDYHKAGLTVRQAALQGGIVRFRPIMMTALAFVFGVMPMLFASGAGAQSRIALGTAVVYGMGINAIIGTLMVPNFWELMKHFQEKYLNKLFAASNTPQGPAQGGNSAKADADTV